jgi:hypothetical protein
MAVEIAIYDYKVEPRIENLDNSRVRLHADPGCEIRTFLEMCAEVSDNQRDELLSLWFNPERQRSFIQGPGFTIVSSADSDE